MRVALSFDDLITLSYYHRFPEKRGRTWIIVEQPRILTQTMSQIPPRGIMAKVFPEDLQILHSWGRSFPSQMFQNLTQFGGELEGVPHTDLQALQDLQQQVT